MNQIKNLPGYFLKRLFEKQLPTRRHNSNIVEYAETTIVPAGPYKGLQYEHSRAPQLREPLELLSPDSPYQEIYMMFPAQSGKTTIAEIVTTYYITEVPSEILYASSNETAAIKWMQRRIVPRAAAAGIEFRSEIESRTSRQTGNTTYSKLFPGGNIDIASTLSAAQMASETKRIELWDEMDRWRRVLGDEGSVTSQLKARTQAWGTQSKILGFSTPTTEDSSLILEYFLMGDQRLYFVACPFCGYMQLMDFSEGKSFGLSWEYKSGKILKKSIVLVCESPSCSREISEPFKNKMLNSGEWRKQAIAEYDFIASFHINGLYSPMMTWYEMAISYDDSKKGDLQKQAHDNLKMGRPHKQTGTRPKVEKIIENRGQYKSLEVPEGVLYLTAGIDVQEGSETNEHNPARLELEILGIGAGYRTWSICYEVFYGETDDPFSGAWEKLNEWAIENNFSFYRKDGFRFPVSLTFIDSSSGKRHSQVYQFSQRWRNCFPIKGFSALKTQKKEKRDLEGDKISESNFRRFRAKKIDEDITLYEISTNYYKNQIYHNLKIAREGNGLQKAGFCDFPRDYDERYFDMLTAEERRRDGSFHNPTGRRNESLDCRVYALCGGDVFLESEVLRFKSLAQDKKWRPDQVQQINKSYVLKTMSKKTAKKKIK